MDGNLKKIKFLEKWKWQQMTADINDSNNKPIDNMNNDNNIQHLGEHLDVVHPRKLVVHIR
jgi:hypothetical protein